MSGPQQVLIAGNGGDTGAGGNDANCLYLNHCNGTNGSTSFTDSSVTAATITSSNVAVDTSQSKFGGGSALFDSSVDYLSVPAGSTYDFGTISSSSNFTVEAWCRFTSLGSAERTIAVHGVPGSGGDGKGGWVFFEVSGDLVFRVSKSSSASNPWIASWRATPGTALATGTWYHLRAVLEAGVPKIYVDGALASGSFETPNAAFGTTMIGLDTTKTGYGMRWGASFTDSLNPTAVNNFAGHMDEQRFSNVARNSSNFTPATGEFT